jgi:hypothetical protein
MKMTALATLLATTLLSAPALATIHYVDVNGGGDYTAIQPAIDAAAGCDTVVVAPGTYTGSLNRNLGFGPKNLVVVAMNGRESPIIDCEGQDRAFFFNYTGQDTISVIQGFTIRNGYTTDYNGGGIIVGGCGVTIKDCIFENCEASHNGGALSISYDQVGTNVRNCVFVGNSATQRGGAVIVDHSSARFHGCLFYDNWTEEVVHESNGGGAFWANGVTYGNGHNCRVTRCTFVANSSPGLGAAVGAWGDCGGFWVSYCIVAFNNGPSYAFDSDPLLEDFIFSVLYWNEGGNADPGYSTLLIGDPLFCDMELGNFELCANSPALPSGNIWQALMGYAGEGCEACDSPVQEKTWGGIKAMFR